MIEKLEAATRGPYQKQFSAERVADALATCRRQWQHFGNSPGKLQAHERWLPGELAEQMRKYGRRSSHQGVAAQSLQSVQSLAVQAEGGAAAALLDADVNAVPGVAQKRQWCRDVWPVQGPQCRIVHDWKSGSDRH